MRNRIIIAIVAVLLWQTSFAGGEQLNDVYIVYYATCKGRTGHMGIAIDNYRIIYKEQAGAGNPVADTLPTGELTYYDLWPDEDHFSIRKTGKDIPAVYYKLPVSSTEEITVNSLYDQGIPHKENYPCDGLLRVPTSWEQDQWLVSFLDSMIDANRFFNGRQFNCSDFVRIPLEKLLDQELKSREFVLAGWSTTPNKLYRRLRNIAGIEVIKNADDKATRSFIGQRVIYTLFHHSKT
jgi:hypothetical protein